MSKPQTTKPKSATGAGKGGTRKTATRSLPKAPEAQPEANVQQITVFALTGPEIQALQNHALDEITKFWNRKRVKNGQQLLMILGKARAMNVNVAVPPQAAPQEGGDQ